MEILSRFNSNATEGGQRNSLSIPKKSSMDIEVCPQKKPPNGRSPLHWLH